MATRPQVEAAIAAIEDEGNNKASEVRDVLTKLLDYTENDTTGGGSPSSLQPFHFFNDGKAEKLIGRRGNSVGAIWYSFKGLVGESVNFTFRIETNSESVFTYLFQVPDQLFSTLQKFFNNNAQFKEEMSFAIPIRKKNNINEIEIGTLSIKLSTQRRVALTFVSQLERTNAIKVYTSLQFHAPKFS
ncbi:MAG: hypothetical protein AAFX55_11800 [Bacteroidota bacterium]